jgi:hypothetical protein
MKIYFTHAKGISKTVTTTISNHLEGLGHTLGARTRTEDFEKADFENARKAFINNTKNIKNADIVVVEASFASSGLGYEVASALEEKKPVIALYNMTEDRDNPRHIPSVPTSLKGNTSKYLILKEYDMRNLTRILDLALNDAKAMVDTKFILIIPPAIDRYLEWNVREKNKPKAVITRESIEKVMLEDKIYQAYLKNSGINE